MTLAGQSMKKSIIAIVLAAFAGTAGVQAQTYPSRQITLVVPFHHVGTRATSNVGVRPAERHEVQIFRCPCFREGSEPNDCQETSAAMSHKNQPESIPAGPDNKTGVY